MSEHILVVEDNAALAENIAELLGDEGYDVTTCAHAEAGQRAAAERGFDLALVDIGLAGSESGLELAPRLKRASVHGEVVLMTGNATLHTALQAMRSGVYGYLPKPFEPDELLALTRRALAQVALKRERQALAQRLATSEALYRGVFETVEASILGLDADGRIAFANRFAGECLGTPAIDLAGQSLLAHSEARATRELSSAIVRASEGETVRDLELRHEAHGRARSVRWTLTPLYATSLEAAQRVADEESAAVLARVLAVGVDITERLELERQSAEAQALGAMGTLATSLAHEIRNPLNAAKLQLELLLRRARKASDVALLTQLEQPALLVRTEIERLSLMLGDFLNLARPRPAQRRTLALRELCEAVITLQRPLAQDARVELDFQCAGELTARVDPDQLKQVLINLVGNAIDALRDAEHGAIALNAEPRAQGGVTISVSDNGPGIAPELLDDAFKPFVTNKPAGTGLGLAIVHKIVAQHGGEVELAPRPEGGTIARFWIAD